MKTLDKDFNKTEDDMKALQSVGQIIGEVLKQLDHARCKSRAASGVRKWLSDIEGEVARRANKDTETWKMGVSQAGERR